MSAPGKHLAKPSPASGQKRLRSCSYPKPRLHQPALNRQRQGHAFPRRFGSCRGDELSRLLMRKRPQWVGCRLSAFARLAFESRRSAIGHSLPLTEARAFLRSTGIDFVYGIYTTLASGVMGGLSRSWPRRRTSSRALRVPEEAAVDGPVARAQV